MSLTSLEGGGLMRLGCVLAVLSFLVAVVAAPVSADPFGTGPPDAGWFADSSNHSYCYGSGFATGLEDEADYAMFISLDGDTVMSATFQSSCDSTTDVRWLDANLPAGQRGVYTCIDKGGDICFRANVTMDPNELNIGPNDHEDKLKTACHEAGHSVGLEHGNSKSDCMINGEIPDTTVQWRRYSTHHISDHINPRYG
jgi:hypothetical protein